MALRHVIVFLAIILLWANLTIVHGRIGGEFARQYRRSADSKERRTRKFDEMILSTARGYGKRANVGLGDDFLMEWIALERMRRLGYPKQIMRNPGIIVE